MPDEPPSGKRTIFSPSPVTALFIGYVAGFVLGWCAATFLWRFAI